MTHTAPSWVFSSCTGCRGRSPRYDRVVRGPDFKHLLQGDREGPYLHLCVLPSVSRNREYFLGNAIEMTLIANITKLKTLPLWIALVSQHHPIHPMVVMSFLSQGWFALRREWKRATTVFLGFGVIYLCIVLAALGSAMFLWALTTWWFFGAMYVFSVILIIATLLLAALCRNNFDKNLDHYCELLLHSIWR